jgi:hypothetical protein
VLSRSHIALMSPVMMKVSSRPSVILTVVSKVLGRQFSNSLAMYGSLNRGFHSSMRLSTVQRGWTGDISVRDGLNDGTRTRGHLACHTPNW